MALKDFTQAILAMKINTLKDLDLWENRINNESAQLLANALKINQTLVYMEPHGYILKEL